MFLVNFGRAGNIDILKRHVVFFKNNVLMLKLFADQFSDGLENLNVDQMFRTNAESKRVGLDPMSKPYSYLLLTLPRQYFCCDFVLLFLCLFVICSECVHLYSCTLCI